MFVCMFVSKAARVNSQFVSDKQVSGRRIIIEEFESLHRLHGL